jgi:plasmid stabilization system protein ParE
MAARRRRVRWSLSAENALDEAIAFVFSESPNTAKRLLEEVLTATASLSTLSDRGSQVPEVDDPGIRQLLCNPYRIIYRVDDEEVVILALLHQRQDVGRWGRKQRP